MMFRTNFATEKDYSVVNRLSLCMRDMRRRKNRSGMFLQSECEDDPRNWNADIRSCIEGDTIVYEVGKGGVRAVSGRD